MSSLKHFFKDTFIYGIAAVLPRVINFLLVKVHTDALVKTSYAENANFYIWAALFAVVLTFGLETAFFRFYKDENSRKNLLSTSFLTVLTTTLFFVIIAFTGSSYFVSVFDFSNNPIQFKLLIAVLAIDTLAMVPFAYLRARNKAVKYALIKLINVAIIVVINLIFLKVIPERIESNLSVLTSIKSIYESTDLVNFIFIANVIGSLFSLILLLPVFRHFNWTFDIILFKKMITYSWPIAIAGIAYVINENLDKFLIGQLLDKSSMGIYAACYKLAIFMNLYIMAFRLGAEPFFFNNASKKDAKETYAKILNYFIIIGALVFVGIVVFIDLIKKLFINEEFWDAIIIVPVVLLANLCLGIYHNLSIWYKLTDKTKFAMLFSVTGAVLTIVINIIFLPKIGYMASAWATLLAYGSMMILSYFIGKKYYPIPYNLKKSVGYMLISILFAFVSFTYFRENYWVSISMVLSFGLLIFSLEKKEVMLLFNNKKS